MLLRGVPGERKPAGPAQGSLITTGVSKLGRNEDLPLFYSTMEENTKGVVGKILPGVGKIRAPAPSLDTLGYSVLSPSWLKSSEMGLT